MGHNGVTVCITNKFLKQRQISSKVSNQSSVLTAVHFL